MTDYRTWRNAGGEDPVRAVQSALAGAGEPLWALYTPLTRAGADGLPSEQLLNGWVAAHQSRAGTEASSSPGPAGTACCGTGDRS